MIVSLRYLQTAMEGAAALENPEDDSVGYILEKGLKETVTEFKGIFLNLMQPGAVG